MSANIYTASPWGARYHALPYDFVLGGGSAGVGKSIILLMDPLPQIFMEHQRCLGPGKCAEGYEEIAEMHPLRWGKSSGRALHLRRTYGELDENKNRALRYFPQIDPDVRWVEKEQTYYFKSGFRFTFGHCQHERDWTDYLSKEFTHIGWDELVTFLKEQFDQISTRLRSSDPVLVKMLKNRAMSNPMVIRPKGVDYKIKDPNWVRERFVKPAPQGNVVFERRIEMSDGSVETDTCMFMPGRLSDNPDPDFRRIYEKKLRVAPRHIQKAQLEGDWFFTMGSYYGAVWNQDYHVCKPFKIPEHWAVFRSMDWGFKAFGCIHWYAMDEDGNLYVFYEYTFKGRTDREVAATVRRIENTVLGLKWRDGQSQITGPADTQLWEKRGSAVSSMAEVFAARGVPWTKANKESRIRNAQEIYRRLGDHRSGTVTPGLVVFEGCKDLIRTLPAVQADDSDPEMPAKDNDSHWHESLGYGCAFASRGHRGIPARVTDEEYRLSKRSSLETATDPYGGI